MRKKKSQIIMLTAATVVAVAAGSTGIAFGLNAKASSDNSALDTKVANVASLDGVNVITDAKYNNLINESKDDGVLTKDETVYVLANADGTTNKVIVSDWLKNALFDASIMDNSTLKDIVNVKGDESFTAGADNSLNWTANGNDIYYQGTTNEELPISLKIRYTLDGQEISPADLVGKSGKVTITFEYTNNQKETVKINGKDEEICVPFAVVSGAIINDDIFRNVEVSNGKLVNDGSKSVVMGFALPGVQESLNIDKDKVEIPESFTITADVTNYEALTTMSVATNEVFNKLNFDGLSDMDSLDGAVDTLTDAMSQLMNGSSDLYDGLSTLLEKSGQLVDAVGKLDEGANTLSEKMGTLANGNTQLNDAIGTLNGGLQKLDSNSDTLQGGAKQVFDSLLSMADTQLKAAGLEVPKLTIDNYSTVLDGVMKNLDADAVAKLAQKTALAKVTEAVKANEATVKEQVTLGVQAKVTEGVLAAAGQKLTAEQYQAAVAAGQIPEELQAKVKAAVAQQMGTKEIKAQIEEITKQKIQELIDTNMKSAEVQAQIKAASSQAATGLTSIKGLKAQLDSYNQFYKGVKDYTAGVGQLAEGSAKMSTASSQLASGSKQLAEGAKTLATNLDALSAAGDTLVDGVSQLADGSKKMKDGLSEFNEKGIDKIVSVLDGDVEGLADRLKAIVDVSKDYNNFSGLGNDMNGNVKFIFKTE